VTTRNATKDCLVCDDETYDEVVVCPLYEEICAICWRDSVEGGIHEYEEVPPEVWQAEA
jgi:hypothetical protein